MDLHGFSSFSLLFLLIAVAVASEAESSRQNRVAGKSEQDATLRAAPTLTTSGTNVTTVSTDVLPEDVGTPEPPSETGEGYEGNQDSNPQREEEEEGEEEEYYEGVEEDEYEDELKAVVAESHEAMSRDDTRNSNVSSPGAISTLIGERSPGAKSFDSHEVITVNDSDEDIASNEAITDEVVNKYDEEVAELLKYKKERNSNLHVADKTKTKRVPTVKKELSTQKEILIGSNETQVPKSLMPSEDTLNRLHEEAEPVGRINGDGRSTMEKSERARSGRAGGEREIAVDNRYSDFDPENPRKLDKRQETVLKDLRSYLHDEYATEEEQRQKLRELGAQEDALAENLLKLLVKLVEDPNRWERVQKLLANVENDLKLSRNALDPTKRGYETTPALFTATPRSSENSRKSRKKLKKKKKKPRRRSTTTTTTTMTPTPAMPQLRTTTETPWQTTPVQWRLVAERLFGPPWQKDLRDEPEDAPKVRYSVPSKPRTLPSVRDFLEQNIPGSGSKTFNPERKPLLSDPGREMTGERLLRFGKVNTHQPAHLQGHREFASAFDRPADPDHPADYDAPEAYQRLRFNQLPPSSREFLRKNEEDYQNDFGMQSENFARNREYESAANDFTMSKSWPDVPYQYDRPWKTDERPLSPSSSGKWIWRQSQNDMNHWPQRNKFLQPERNYWSPLGSEDVMDEESEAEKIWQQQQQQQRLPIHSWDRDRSSAWPVEKSLKMPPNWQQTERSMTSYDRDQPQGIWEKGKNRSELNKSSMKQESKEKGVLPQITMKTWNSLTSDPATWPYKLPGAKPWPKDENGKSYNPNADLVKKLGLDKQNDVTWSKEDGEKSGTGEETKNNKQNRMFPVGESSKEEVPGDSKYRSTEEKNNYSNYKTRSNLKEWKSRESESPQNDEASAWGGKYEPRKDSWQSEDSLPKIQSLGAWVMAADQSTWKPYPLKPIDSNNDGSSGSRRWTNARSAVGEYKWPSKEGRWAEKMNDSWMERGNVESWPGKPGKSSPWYAKSKEEPWTSKSSDADSWKTKEDPSWLAKPNESSYWSSKVVDNNSWAVKENGSPWSMKTNESWTTKGNDRASKFNRDDSWSTKIKDDEGWASKSSDATWKANEGNSWHRKSAERNGWNAKNNDLRSWQQKMNEEWNYGKGVSTGTWPTKWKQFAYHRVTAMPISKPGTTADAASSKSKNAYVAVSAVSSAQNSGNDQWRKSEEDGRGENLRSEDQERGSNQVQVALERPIYAWKKDTGVRATVPSKGNATDPLENQLEALRQIDFWSYKENQAENVTTATNATMQTPSITPSITPSNSTTTAHRRTGITTKDNGGGTLETNRQTIPMK